MFFFVITLLIHTDQTLYEYEILGAVLMKSIYYGIQTYNIKP